MVIREGSKSREVDKDCGSEKEENTMQQRGKKGRIRMVA